VKGSAGRNPSSRLHLQSGSGHYRLLNALLFSRSAASVQTEGECTVETALANAWGEFLGRYQWDWFCTFTFREPPKSFTAHRQFQRFARDVSSAAGRPVAWFRADEIGLLGRFHLHGLFRGTEHLRRFDWIHEWEKRAGWARILPYDARRGASYYCAKYVTKQFGEWELGSSLGDAYHLKDVFGSALPKETRTL
jgi:hypothetical protein